MTKKVLSIETGVWWTKVCLVDYRKTNPHIYHSFYMKTPEHAIEDGYIRDKESFAKALKEELAKRMITEKSVVFSISSSRVVTREVTIPMAKDRQIPGIVMSQAREYFPMDITGYTISWKKMETVTAEDGAKNLKLWLSAVPDNLLSNHYSFAKEAGLTIETFDYIGSGAVSFITSHLSEKAVIVQLEEQATIITMISDKKLLFQRIAPYGYATALSAVMSHSILEVKDEFEAFEFLKAHDVLHNDLNPDEFINPEGDYDRELKITLLKEAVEDIREALDYHTRVLGTALEYYQNQTKTVFSGKVYLLGDGVKIAGLKEYAMSELPLESGRADFSAWVRYQVKPDILETEKSKMTGFLSVIGAATNPLDIKPKEMKERDAKKNNMHMAYVILAGCALISVALVLSSSIRYLMAVTEQKELKSEIQKLSYINEIYQENTNAKNEAARYQAFDELTKTKNEMFSDLMTELENKMPKGVAVQALSISGDNITINMTSTTKLTTAQMLLNFEEIPFIDNLSIPSMVEADNISGGTVWQYTLLANYVQPRETQEDDAE